VFFAGLVSITPTFVTLLFIATPCSRGTPRHRFAAASRKKKNHEISLVFIAAAYFIAAA
jgi:hypothetical protein